MTERIKVRAVIEYDVLVEEYEKHIPDSELLDWNNATDDPSTVHLEIVSRKHEVDYVSDVDLKRELWLLRADGEIIFEHRSHDVRNQHYLDLTGNPAPIGDPMWWYGDKEDHDKSWKVIKAK